MQDRGDRLDRWTAERIAAVLDRAGVLDLAELTQESQ